MRITRVELENIKSYRRASIPLGAGTIAIRGHNGAGKSTLVEAIGFALFDALGYSQEQFVREGERYGAVTISFLSALDGREYQVVRRCGTAAAWYVYDPEPADAGQPQEEVRHALAGGGLSPRGGEAERHQELPRGPAPRRGGAHR